MDPGPLFPGMVNTVGALLPALIAFGIVVARQARSGLRRAQRPPPGMALAQAQTGLDEEQARSLLARDDRRSVEEALKRWRELEKKSQPGSPPWFRAKYSLALSHYRLGNTQQAAKIIELLQLLHPGSGGPEMKARFDDLLRRCRE